MLFRSKVVDASVVAALVFVEQRSQEAKTLVEGAQLAAPNLLKYELANIAWKKITIYKEDSGAVMNALQLAFAMNIREIIPAASKR